MDQNEKSLIDDLYRRLQLAEQKTGPRDAQAEAVIREHFSRQPGVAYYMTQAMLVQEHALKSLNERVQQLEQELASRPAAGGGSFLSGLFGGGASSAPAGRAGIPPYQPQPGAFQQTPRGGFLSGALQTAAGVAGGVLLGHALMSMFSDVFGDSGAEAVAAAVPEAAENFDLASAAEDIPSSGGFLGDAGSGFGGFGDSTASADNDFGGFGGDDDDQFV